MPDPASRAAFSLPAAEFEPAYLALHRRGELRARALLAVARLEACTGCPRRCRVNRLVPGKLGVCQTGRYAGVASYGPHHGEEACLRGTGGSGTIFFARCPLGCVFCQNWSISHAPGVPSVQPERLAAMMLELQAAGCHNINLVTPEHVAAQIIEALPLAVEQGLRLPLVYNTSGFDALPTLALLDGIVDIYLPDFKIWHPHAARTWLHARDYPAAARASLREMHRQVGVLKLDEHGLARRGVLVRHLVLPGRLAGTREIMRFVARELSPDSYVNLMAQYHPAGLVAQSGATDHPWGEMRRRLRWDEYANALDLARAEGLYRLDEPLPAI
jgi:putative pyruvate formate lyase activating enzyme